MLIVSVKTQVQIISYKASKEQIGLTKVKYVAPNSQITCW